MRGMRSRMRDSFERVYERLTYTRIARAGPGACAESKQYWQPMLYSENLDSGGGASLGMIPARCSHPDPRPEASLAALPCLGPACTR